MSLNWKEIDLILSEWNIIGAKIQQVLQPQPNCIFLEVYVPYAPAKITEEKQNTSNYRVQYIYIYLENGEVRIYRNAKKIKKPKVAQRFQQLLQSRILGRTIERIEHINKDRIIQFTLSKNNVFVDSAPADNNSTSINNTTNNSNKTDTKSEEKLLLYCKLWSNQANILLTNTENTIVDLVFRRPKQALMPGNTFVIPERSTKKTEQNTTIRDGYKQESSASFNQFIEAYYSNKKAAELTTNTKAKYEVACHKQHSLLSQKLASIQSAIAKCDAQLAAENYGNIILSNMYSITSEDTTLCVKIDDADSMQKEIIIPLNSSLSPAQNAEYYFTKLRKAKQNRIHLQEQLNRIEETLSALAKIKLLLEDHALDLHKQQLAMLFPQEIRAEKQQHISIHKSGIKIFFQDGPYLVMAGRNVKENDTLLRKYVKGKDMWLHVRGYNGCYVFIRAQGDKSISLEMLEKAGQIAALYSKAKNESYADIYYTQVKHLKRVKKTPGLVVPMRDANLQIKIDSTKTKQYLRAHTL